jgi:glycosyltransferase involved in cell wall biosynthesis
MASHLLWSCCGEVSLLRAGVPMKRFGTVFPFLEAGQQSRHMGRLVANHDFAKALLTYGTFDEYLFSNTSASNLKTFADTTQQWGLSDERRARIRYASYVDLPDLLRRQSFHVFHLGGWGAFMPGLHYIRARYASNPWPITGVTHSLNGREVIDHAVRISHAAMAPYDAIFCTSRDGREAMRKLLAGGAAIAGRSFAGQLEHLPLGIDDELADRTGNRERARTRLRIASDTVVLLVLGRMTPFQKMDLGPLLRTFAQQIVSKSPRPVCLLLAGNASPEDLRLLKDSIERYALEPHVKLQANFPAEQKADVLAAADILVSPVDNTQETFGLSLLEAMAAGLPVVASRFDGYKDLVDDGVDGFLIDSYASPSDPMEEWFDLLDPNIAQLFQSQGVAIDPAQLAARTLQLIGNDGLRASMAAAGRNKIGRDYRWSRVIARYEAVWDQLAAEAARVGIVQGPTAANPFNLGPASVFSHYASHTLRPDRRVTATRQALDDTPYTETSPILRPALLHALLSGARGGASLDALVASAGAPADHAWYALTWLIKYGLLTMD